MTHPLCVDCEAKGVLAATELVGHKKPVRWFPELFWEPTNHKPQCTRCNREQEIKDGRKYGGKG
jgi:5-methylcytosine-specific restriction endonuclease McrA